jgi:hypothetical protein
LRADVLAVASTLLVAGGSAGAAAGQEPCPWPAPAQLLADRASPPDSTIVRLGDVPIKVCYGRPSARGRVVFGGLVPYGRTWRTGANEPTTLQLPVSAEVAGVALQSGTYLLLTIPAPDEWTVLLNTTAAQTAAEMFRAMDEVGRATVPARLMPDHVEVFTIRGSSGEAEAALILEWERTRVRIPLRRIEGNEGAAVPGPSRP